MLPDDDVFAAASAAGLIQKDGGKLRMVRAPREPQYAPCFDESPVTLGPMTGATWRWNPRRLGMMLARYKFVAKMFEGFGDVAEIGCADGFGAAVVGEAVWRLALFDFDPLFVDYARSASALAGNAKTGVRRAGLIAVHDILEGPLPGTQRCGGFDGIYLLDVLEHIAPADEARALDNIVASLRPHGACIIGMPSLESQAYASEVSKAGHVNCKTGEQLRESLKPFFRNVFLFGMNDEVLHTGFPAMCHYLFALCTGPKA